MPVRLVLDWDGTVTEVDRLHAASRSSATADIYDARSALGRELTLHEVIAVEIETVRAPLEEVVGPAREHACPRRLRGARAPARPARRLERLPRAHRAGARARGHRARGRANRLDPRPEGWRAVFRSKRPAPVCGEPCKRADVAGIDEFVYVGDGFSDRCVARAATGSSPATASPTTSREGVPSSPSRTSTTSAAARRRSRRAAGAQPRPEHVARLALDRPVDLAPERVDRGPGDLVDRLLDVVSGGCVQVAASIPSKPTIERSSGTRRPRATASCTAPIAIRSLEQISPSAARPRAARSSRSAFRPPATPKSACATRPSADSAARSASRWPRVFSRVGRA